MCPSKLPRWNVKCGIKILTWSLLLLFLDQGTKLLAKIHLKDQPPFVLLEGVFELHYLENPWAAFSLGKGLNDAFLIIVLILTILFCSFLTVLAFRLPSDKRFRIVRLLVILFMAGALGNFIDRIQYHYVVDFFYFKLIDFPVFNVADIYVVVGAILFVASFLFKGELYEELFPSKKKRNDHEG